MDNIKAKLKAKLKEDEFANRLISSAKAVAANSPDDLKKIYDKNTLEIDAISGMLKDVKPPAAAAALDAKEAAAANGANGAVGARQNGLRAAVNGVRAIGAMQPNNEPMAAANEGVVVVDAAAAKLELEEARTAPNNAKATVNNLSEQAGNAKTDDAQKELGIKLEAAQDLRKAAQSRLDAAEKAVAPKGGRKRTKKTNYYRKRRGTRRRGSRRRGSSRRRRSSRN